MESKNVKRYNNINSEIMKKLALTTVLFSLVMVLTSFNTSETSNSLSNTLGIDPPGGGQNSGGVLGGGKKSDGYTSNHLTATNNVSSGADSQSAISYKKID